MKTPIIFFVVILLSLLLACEDDSANEPEVPFSKSAITGEWLVVYQKHKQNNFYFKDEIEGVVASWGCFYVLSIHIKDDHTFYINNSEFIAGRIDADSASLGGKWQLAGDQINFTCNNEITTSFKASMKKDGSLMLENEQLLLQHHKKKETTE